MVTRQAHNLEILGSIPKNATSDSKGVFFFVRHNNEFKLYKKQQEVYGGQC